MLKYAVEGQQNERLLVFVNGAGVSKWMWRYQKSFAAEYKCIFFDLPGHGDNSNIDFSSIEEVSHQITQLIEKESISGQAVVIGHSIGAQITLDLMKSYRNYLTKAVIISGLNHPLKTLRRLVKPTIALSMPLIKSKSFAKMQFKQFGLPEIWFEDYYQDSLKISRTTLTNISLSNLSFDFSQTVADLPVLILVGEQEKSIMKKSAYKTANFLPNSQLLMIKSAGHGIPYEQPEQFNDLLNGFLDLII